MTDIEDLKEDITEIKENTQEIFKALNGKCGLITQQALIIQSVDTIDGRVAAIEKRKWIRGPVQFVGGIIGGALAFIGIKMGSP